MPSPRSRFESACRVGAFGLLGWLLGTSVFPSLPARVETANARVAAEHVAGWTRSGPYVALHGTFESAPEPWLVDWLSALRRSGHPVTWSGAIPAVAMRAAPLADPDGGVRVDVAAPAGRTIVVRDDAGPIDTIRVTRLGGVVRVPRAVGAIAAADGAQRLSVAAAHAPRLRSIVVLGEAGWEGKFISTALEERGWSVTSRFSVAPNVDVTREGSGAPVLDTSQVAVVVAVDSSAGRYAAALDRFVRSGGGVVLAGNAARSGSLAAIAAGTVGERVSPAVLPADTIGLGSTGFYPVSRLATGAVALDRRSGGVVMAARRVGAGRVVQVGYDDSWRWRMAGGPGSPEAHRAWWSRVVGSAAYLPAAGEAPLAGALEDPATAARAPLAWIVARLGPASGASRPGSHLPPVDRRILITLIMILLLSEWASRRMRGLR